MSVSEAFNRFFEEIVNEVSPSILQRGKNIRELLESNGLLEKSNMQVSVDRDTDDGIIYMMYDRCAAIELAENRTVVTLWIKDKFEGITYHLPLDKEQDGVQMVLSYAKLHDYQNNHSFAPTVDPQ